MEVKLSLPLGLEIVFPEGRNIPQSLNDRRQMFDDVIHLFLGIIDRKAETDGAMGGCKGDTHCPEDV
jgi:hypothetical protein